MGILNMTYWSWWGSTPVPLNWVSNLTASWWDWQANIKWTDVWDLTVNGVALNQRASAKLVRKSGSAPTDSSDWTLILTETTQDTYSSTAYTDTWLTNGTTYYYAVFSVATDWQESISNIAYMTPWTNYKTNSETVVFYPLDSTNTLNDLGGWNYTLTNSWSVAFGTNQWVDCAWFTSWGTSSWSRWLYRTTDYIIDTSASDLTFNIWLYKGSETMRYNPRIITWYNADISIFTYASLNRISIADSTTYGVQPDSNARFLFTCVYDHNNYTWTYYKNAVYQNVQTAPKFTVPHMPWIVLWTRDNLWTWYWDKWSGWMSYLIIEKWKWSASDVSYYFDKMKATYWLS